MILQDYLNDEQIKLCEESGIIIEDKDYSSEELYIIEQKIIRYINNNCIDEKFYLIEEKFDEILDILMDLESESDEVNPMLLQINEDDHVELNNGKHGIVADITNNVYTIEIDDSFKTGDIDEDIVIVSANSIVRII